MMKENSVTRAIWLSSILVFAAGCTSSTLRVRSVPDGAEVTYISRDGNPVRVGNTPLELDSVNSPGIFSEPTQIQVRKDGYTPQSVLVPKFGLMGGSGQVNFVLSQTELPKICNTNNDIASEIARGVTEISSLIQRKRYQDANGLLQSLIVKYPGLSVLYDLKGNIAFLQKNLTVALDAFKQSNSMAPNNPATLNMIERLQTLQGGGR